MELKNYQKAVMNDLSAFLTAVDVVHDTSGVRRILLAASQHMNEDALTGGALPYEP